MMVQGVASGLIHGWVDFHLDVPTVCPATQPNQAIFPSVQSELGRHTVPLAITNTTIKKFWINNWSPGG